MLVRGEPARAARPGKQLVNVRPAQKSQTRQIVVLRGALMASPLRRRRGPFRLPRRHRSGQGAGSLPGSQVRQFPPIGGTHWPWRSTPKVSLHRSAA